MDYDRPPDTITEGLASLNVDALKPLASLCTSRVPTRKQELIDLVYRSLQDPAFVAEQVGALDRTAKLGLAEAVYGDGTVDQGRFQAHYGVPFTLPATSWSYGSAARRSPDSVRLGLFFYQGHVPRDLRPRLRELLPAPAPFVLPTSDALPEAMISEDDEAEPITVLSTEEAATHDLLTTLRLAAQGKLAVGEATHQPTAGAVRLLREGYLLPDVPTAEEASRADDAVRACQRNQNRYEHEGIENFVFGLEFRAIQSHKESIEKGKQPRKPTRHQQPAHRLHCQHPKAGKENAHHGGRVDNERNQKQSQPDSCQRESPLH